MGCTQGAAKSSASTQKPTTLLTHAHTILAKQGESAEKDTSSTAPEVLGETDAATARTTVDCTFYPGRLGVVADGASGFVKSVSPGQAQELGVRVDWQMLFIDGQQFTLPLLDARIGGQDAYNITFAPPLRSVACTFQPGMSGLTAVSGTVTIVRLGQGQELGVEVGWQITHIDGQPYTGELLDSKKEGEAPYVIIFALGGASQIDKPRSLRELLDSKIVDETPYVVTLDQHQASTIDQPEYHKVEEQKVEAPVAESAVSPRLLHETPEADEQNVTPIAVPTDETVGVTGQQQSLCCL